MTSDNETSQSSSPTEAFVDYAYELAARYATADEIRKLNRLELSSSPVLVDRDREWPLKLCQAMRLDAGQITLNWARQFLSDYRAALAIRQPFEGGE